MNRPDNKKSGHWTNIQTKKKSITRAAIIKRRMKKKTLITHSYTHTHLSPRRFCCRLIRVACGFPYSPALDKSMSPTQCVQLCHASQYYEFTNSYTYTRARLHTLAHNPTHVSLFVCYTQSAVLAITNQRHANFSLLAEMCCVWLLALVLTLSLLFSFLFTLTCCHISDFDWLWVSVEAYTKQQFI